VSKLTVRTQWTHRSWKSKCISVTQDAPALYGTWKFATVHRGDCHQTVPETAWTQSMSSQHIPLRSILTYPPIYAEVFQLPLPFELPDQYFISFSSLLYAPQDTVSLSFIMLSRVRGSVTNNNGFWIGWSNLLALLLQLQSIITARNRFIPYCTTSVFSSTVTDLVLIYESVTSSASVVRWLTLHSWTLNYDSRPLLRMKDLRINYVSSFYTSVRTEYRTLPSTVHVILCLSFAA
jgi:hypothetical protein